MNNQNLPAILENGRFNLSHIVRRASVHYRRFNGKDRLDWKLAMLSAWAEARGEMQLFQARNGWRCTVMVAVARDVSLSA